MPLLRWIPAALCLACLLAPAVAPAAQPASALRPDWKISDATRDGLLEGPTFRAIKEHYPADYARIEAKMEELVKQGATARQTMVVMRAEAQAVMLRSASAASDEAITQMTRTIVEVISAVGAQDVDACGALLFGDGGSGFDYLERLPPALGESVEVRTAEVIRSSHVAPQPVPTEDEVMDDMSIVMTPVFEKYGDMVERLGSPDAPPAERAAACNITIDIYRGVLTLPQERAGPILRFMYGSAEASAPEPN